MKKIFVVLTLLSLIVLTGCKSNSVYKIGFAGTLTGNYASVGISEMYGTELAIEEINAAGGINGKQIELIIRDDEASSEKAVEVDNELKELGVNVIIGHSLSIVAESAIENANENDILLLSPSIGSDAFSGVEDNLIRNISTTYFEGEAITNKIIEDQAEKVLLIYNLDNFILTKYHKSGFEDTMKANGYTTDDYDMLEFTSGAQDDILSIKSSLSSGEYDTTFIVGSNTDVAPLVNYITGNNLDINVHLSSWASIGLSRIIETVNTDGIFLYFNFVEEVSSTKYLMFKERFEDKFGQDVDMLCVNAYDLVYMLKTAVEKSDSFEVNDIKKEIYNQRNFIGIVGDYSIDEFGDCTRRTYQMIIEDGVVILNE